MQQLMWHFEAPCYEGHTLPLTLSNRNTELQLRIIRYAAKSGVSSIPLSSNQIDRSPRGVGGVRKRPGDVLVRGSPVGS